MIIVPLVVVVCFVLQDVCAVCIVVVGDVGVLLSTFITLPVATEATSATTEVAR